MKEDEDVEDEFEDHLTKASSLVTEIYEDEEGEISEIERVDE